MPWDHAYFDLRPGTPEQIKKTLDKASKRGWEFMAFDERRSEKGKTLPGVIVWVRRRKLPGHG